MKRALSDKQQDALVQLLGKPAVCVDDNSRKTYGADWSQAADPDPVAVVFPSTREQLHAIIAYANEWRWPLVPSGGRTGLAGAAVAAHGEIVVSLEKMNRILELDTRERLLICEPGVITAQVQQAAREHGLFYPVEFGAEGSSQVGGNIATNAGGVRVLRYGMTRAQVAGLQAVTGHGTWIDEMRCLRKDNAGYALRELLIGSEGTLAITTQAGLRLCEPMPALATVLLLLDDINTLPEVLRAMQRFPLYACEWMDQRAFALGNEAQANPLGVASAAGYLMIEAPADAMTVEALSAALATQPVADVLLAQSSKQAEGFWAVRDSITGALKPRHPLKFDVGFRASRMPAVFAAIAQQWPDAVVYGHLGDGNLHLNLVNVQDPLHAQAQVWQIVKQFQGTITAEHGIGMLRSRALQSTEAHDRLSAMRAIKQALDPNGILNPGKLVST